MRTATIIALTVLLSGHGATAQQWIETTRLGVNPDNSKGPIAVYVGGNFAGWSDAQAIPMPMAPGQWHRVTLPSSVPADVRAVFLSGLLIITHPSDANGVRLPIICNVTGTVRAPGSSLHEGNYQLQAITTATADGVRSNAATWVPVVDRTFEFFYTMTPGCPTLINLSLQAYTR